MCIKTINPTVVHDNDAVRILHAADALRDNQLRSSGDSLRECRADLRVRRRINRTGGIIQDQNLRLLQ